MKNFGNEIIETSYGCPSAPYEPLQPTTPIEFDKGMPPITFKDLQLSNDKLPDFITWLKGMIEGMKLNNDPRVEFAEMILKEAERINA